MLQCAGGLGCGSQPTDGVVGKPGSEVCIETFLGHLYISIYFIGHHIPKLCIPGVQVLVGDFPLHIEHHDAGVGLVAAVGMLTLELLLASCTLKVHKHSLAIHCGCVLVQGLGICGKQLGLKPMRNLSLSMDLPTALSPGR